MLFWGIIAISTREKCNCTVIYPHLINTLHMIRIRHVYCWEVRINSLVKFSERLLPLDTPLLVDQQNLTFIRSVWILVSIIQTKDWMETESMNSFLSSRLGDRFSKTSPVINKNQVSSPPNACFIKNKTKISKWKRFWALGRNRLKINIDYIVKCATIVEGDSKPHFWIDTS